MQQEQEKHMTAFNAYYALGTNRNLNELHLRYAELIPEYKGKPPSLPTLKNWSRHDSWQERIMIRDRDIAKDVEKKIIKEEVNIRLKAYNRVRQYGDTLASVLGTAFFKDKKDNDKRKLRSNIAISSARELKEVAIGALKCEEAALNILAPEIELKHTGAIELKTPQIDPVIAKEAAKLITKMQSEQTTKKTKL